MVLPSGLRAPRGARAGGGAGGGARGLADPGGCAGRCGALRGAAEGGATSGSEGALCQRGRRAGRAPLLPAGRGAAAMARNVL